MSDRPNDWVVPDEGATLDDPYSEETAAEAQNQRTVADNPEEPRTATTSPPQGPPSSLGSSTSSAGDTAELSAQQEFYENEDVGDYDDVSGIDLDDADMGSLDSDNSVGTWIFVLFGVLWFFFAVCGECL